MPIEKTDIETFLKLSKEFPVLDVRSPGEFIHAHFPDAHSVPLFTDVQRKIIGTAYKKQSRKIAVEIGINYFSERMKSIQKEVIKITEARREKKTENSEATSRQPAFLLYCWRGGMRSETVAWLLSLYGYDIYVLKGGYKTFRRWTLKQFEKEYQFKILGGYTGSGKTEVLKEIKKEGASVVDLEGLANHRGSSFGSLGQYAQPSQEMFENLLALELSRQVNGHSVSEKTIWLEDESRHIGSVGFPQTFWKQMQNSPLYFIDIPFQERLNYIVNNYGNFDKEELTTCILNIQKRLGGLETKNALQFLGEGNVKGCFEILIRYYDKLYQNGLVKREKLPVLLNKIACNNVDQNNARFLINTD
ncbi:MAG: tRNA 2-selenouridine(34) synthase MnmH [Ginsengibacter sp.]